MDIFIEGSFCCDVIYLCIYSGWLEIVYDIVDDMEMVNVIFFISIYMLFLNVYCIEKMLKEVEVLVK